MLAALDLAEIDPLWATVIDRLRVAAAGEGNAGRARAALVYALARSGDTAGAKSELERVRALPTPHPLLAVLTAFVTRVPAGKAAPVAVASVVPSASASAVPTVVDINSLPRSPAPSERRGGGGGGSDEPSGEHGGGGNPRDLLKQAAAAENRGQFARATKLYEDAMHADPANSEALAGLGSVALEDG